MSFSLPAGYIMGVVGQNGAGKSTTIRCILNMAARDGGEIKIFGLDNVHDELAVKQELAVVFDEIFFVDTWRVREVEKAIQGFYTGWDSKVYSEYLKKFQLSPKKRVKELSRGMKMKLMLAVAMSHSAKLLILDEPTSGLHPVARHELLNILQEHLHIAAIEVFGIFYKCLEKPHEQKYTVSKSPKQLTAMVSAFILGLVELNSTGHLEPEKGLDDAIGLINSFIDLIFV